MASTAYGINNLICRYSLLRASWITHFDTPSHWSH